MACKDHSADFLSVVTPCVRRPIALLPVLNCGRCKPPKYAYVNQCCVGVNIKTLMYQLLVKLALLSFPKGAIDIE